MIEDYSSCDQPRRRAWSQAELRRACSRLRLRAQEDSCLRVRVSVRWHVAKDGAGGGLGKAGERGNVREERTAHIEAVDGMFEHRFLDGLDAGHVEHGVRERESAPRADVACTPATV
jgi:hypothetical protein